MATTIAVRTRKSRKADAVAYSELSVRQNAAILEYCRTSMSALSGATAGIMGLTGLVGFILYFVSAFILSVFLTVKAGYKWNSYFITRRVLFINGLFGGLFRYIRLIQSSGVMGEYGKLTYILFWTFLYGMVHVY